MTNRIIGAVLLGFAAYWLAIGMSIPAWRSWEPGDAFDIGLVVCMAVVALTNRKD